MLAFHPYRWNQLKVIPVVCSAPTRSVLSNATSRLIYILKKFNSRTVKKCKTFRPDCRNCPKDDKFRYFIPIFRKLRAAYRTWLMARWKARGEFLLSIIGLLFLSLTVEALQSKRRQDSLLSGGVRSVRAKTSGGMGRPWGIFLVSAKLDIFLSDSANCTALRAVVLTQYRRVTDGRTDRRNCRS